MTNPTGNISTAQRVLYTLAGVFVLFGVFVLITGGWTFEIFRQPASLTRANHPFSWALYLILAGVIFTDGRLGFSRLVDRVAELRPRKVFLYLMIIIALLEIAHFAFGLKSKLWHLDSQVDFGTYYHCILLFFTGTVLLKMMDAERERGIRKTWGWIPVMIVFFGISIDELISFHNGIPGHLKDLGILPRDADFGVPKWPILLAPLALAVVIYFFAFLWKRLKKHPPLNKLLVAAIVIWVLAYASELLLATGMNHLLQVGLEEGLEKLGSSMFLVIFLDYYRRELRPQ
ncbi:MAG TPA: hypothetical protein ENN07_08095 [candidate division Zixibacteria bacterium]|nr:hypothetical protein [candidate division Zixibacteria bacterium]